MHDVLVSVERDTDVQFGDVRALGEVETSKVDNITREADQTAEQAARFLLKAYLRNTPYKNSLQVWGEESICEDENLSFKATQQTVALLDMIDGTDLVNRHLGNWCSAMVFFYPPTREILASIVGLPTREFYVAMPGEAPYKVHLRTDAARIPPPLLRDKSQIKVSETPVSLSEAAICFYGQKARNLLSVVGSRFPEAKEALGDSRFGDYLHQVFVSRPKMRIYTLAGNPMMARLAEGTVHGVFELLGQKPHDVIPGAFIATQAGAYLSDLESRPIDMMGALLEPNKTKLRYVLASSRSLADQIRCALRGGSIAETASR